MLLLLLFQVMASWDGWLIGTEAFWNPLRWVQAAVIGILALFAMSARRSVQRLTAVAGLLLARAAALTRRGRTPTSR